MLTNTLVHDAARQLTVCNACRYCEGYCPVFPAIEIRREFKSKDIFYLANLCHDCRACYSACMYAPPHEFAINLPKILAESRLDSYRALTWPAQFGQAFSNWKIGTLVAVLPAGLVLVAEIASLLSKGLLTSAQHGPGAFYRLISFRLILLLASVLSLLASGVLVKGAIGFWWGNNAGWPNVRTLYRTAADILSLHWLRGGGPGCYYPKNRLSSARRIFHALTFLGFLYAIVSTSLAAFYQHCFHRVPPYSLDSAPVLFGTTGGIAMVVGTWGLIIIKISSDREPADGKTLDMDYLFLILVNLASLTGILTIIVRDTRALGLILSIHLAVVAAFFCSLPYGKFVHAVYRSLALLKYRAEHTSR
jgi:citrate/tricarballylate utilization protein